MRAGVARNPLLRVAAVTAGLASTSAHAAEWMFTPSSELFTRTQQNPHLSADKKEEKEVSTGVGVQASVALQGRTERLIVAVQPLVTTYRYPDKTDLDRNEAHLTLSLNWLGEKVSWLGTAAAAHDTTLTSELGNTGQTQGNFRHESYNLTFGPTWRVNERMQARSSLGVEESRYPGSAGSSLSDYRYSSAVAGTSYGLTDRATLTLQGSAGRLESKGADSVTDNASLSLQARYVWSPVLSFGAGFGPSWVRTDAGKQQGLLYSADITRTFETAALSLSASRKQSPSGLAYLTEVDEATLAFSAQITERLTGTASAGITRRQNVLRDFNLDLTRVRYTRAELGVSWHLASNWHLGASLGNAVQQVGSDFFDGSTGRGYDARLSLSWSGNPHVK